MNTFHTFFRSFLKTKLSVLSFLVLLVCFMVSAFTEKETPLNLTQSYCLENIKLFQAELDTFQRAVDSSASQNRLISRFKKTRVAFKRIEFIAEYLDNNRYPFFNGVNAVEMDDGFDPNAKPEGLQVVESELYSDSLDYDRISYLTRQLKYRTLAFYLILKNAKLLDTYIFEAIRFHLIRMETLNLVSFDSPNVRNNVEEIRTALITLKTIVSFYKNDRTTKESTALQQLFASSEKYLMTQDFKSLDRLYFIKQHIQPLSAQILKLQQKLSIPFLDVSAQVFRAVNVNYKTIYDADFINTKFFASDKYYSDNPMYAAIGKKLFFDKGLSADGSLSCSSCHQPANSTADGLPTSITNKAGVFQKRNTPSILNAAFQAAYFYDFSATSLETQINHVVINPQEFNHSYDEIIKRISSDTQYVRLFVQAFPEYKNYAVSIQTITLCIAEYERKFTFLNSRFDQYMRGQISTIDESVKRGFNVFMGKAQCGSCHFAPTYFGLVPPFYGVSEAEVLGLTKSFDTIRPILDDDIGRFKNFEIDQFKFAMKTSTVRNAELTAPYMHNGGFKTLEEVIEFYEHGGGAGLKLDVPNQTLPDTRLQLSKQEKKDLVSFMKALTDTSGISTLF